MTSRHWFVSYILFATMCGGFLASSHSTLAQESPAAEASKPAAATPAKTQEEREAALAKLLSGATLEGSFTSTRGGQMSERLRTDKYTLGDVKKLNGRTWMIQAKIQYRDSDAVMVPLMLPIDWAGDTPVIVVDNVSIYGMGTFSARVMFFDNHYMGYWKHDDRGGHLFGMIRPATAAAPQAEKAEN
jgi:hypothetical protein